MNINIDASTVSKSSSHSSAFLDAEDQKKHQLEALFPFFDQLSQKIEPNIFYYIQLIIMGAQSVITCLWVGDMGKITRRSISSKILEYLISISNLKGIDESDTALIIRFSVYLVLFVIVAGVIIIQQVVYKKRHRYNISLLYPCRIVIEIIPPVMLTPVASLIGTLVSEIVNKDYPETQTVLFAFSLVMYIGFAVVFYFVYNMFGISPYLIQFPLGCFNISHFVYFVVISSLFDVYTMITNVSPRYLIYIVLEIQIFAYIWLFIVFASRPFTSRLTNVYEMAILLSCVILDFYKLICEFFKSNTDITLIMIVVSLIMSGMVSYIVIRLRERSLSILLIEREGEEATDTFNMDLFCSLKMNSSRLRALEALHFMVEYYSPYLTDMSIVRFLYETRNESPVLREIIKILSFFPGESRVLNNIQIDLLKKKRKTIFETFLCSQVSWMRFIRQSSASKTATEKLRCLKQMTKDLQDEICTFWTSNEISNNYLISIYESAESLKSLWLESLTEYPNSTVHTEGYYKFLINVQSDFKEGIIIKHRYELIEGGRNFNTDICFRNFVRTFPMYLKKQVIDFKGNFVRKTKKPETQSTNSTSKNSDFMTDSSGRSIDDHIEEEIGRTLINHSRLRLTLQTSTKTRKFHSCRALTIIFAFVFIVLTICTCFMLGYFYNYFDSRTEMAECTDKTNNIYYGMLSGNVALLLVIAGDHGILSRDQFKEWEALDTSLGLKPFFDFDSNFRWNVIDQNLFSRNNNEMFLEMAVDMIKRDKTMYEAFYDLFYDTSVLYYCSGGTKMPHIMVNFKQVVLYMQMCQSLIVGSDSSQWYHNLSYFCALESTFHNLSNSFQKVRLGVTAQNTDKYQRYIVTLKSFVNLTFAVVVIVTFVPLIVGFILTLREFKLFKSILLGFNIDTKRNAMKPLIKADLLDDDEAKTGENNAHSSHVQKIDKIITFTFSLFFLIALLACLIEIQLYFSISGTNHKMESISIWLANSRRRKANVLQMIYFLCQGVLLSNTSYIHPSTFTSTSYSFERGQARAKPIDDINKQIGGHFVNGRLFHNELIITPNIILFGNNAY